VVDELVILPGTSVGTLIFQRSKTIHRDLKPQDLVLNECLEPKIADLDLPRSLTLVRRRIKQKTLDLELDDF
jgi:serine/threonine protein kinase